MELRLYKLELLFLISFDFSERYMSDLIKSTGLSMERTMITKNIIALCRLKKHYLFDGFFFTMNHFNIGTA